MERAAVDARGPGREDAGGGPASDEDLYWYRRMVAKLDGFLDSPAQTLRRYPEGDASEAATLARAVAWHRRPTTPAPGPRSRR